MIIGVIRGIIKGSQDFRLSGPRNPIPGLSLGIQSLQTVPTWGALMSIPLYIYIYIRI